MDFSSIKKWVIPEGNVVSVQDSSGKVIWTAPIVTIVTKDFCGAPGMSQNDSMYGFAVSYDKGKTWTVSGDEQNINSYSDRILIKFGTLEVDTSEWIDAGDEDYGNYLIASGSKMSSIYNETWNSLISGASVTWDELKTKVINTLPEVFEEGTCYGGKVYEINLSKYTPTQMMGNPKYIDPNYPLYIFFGNDFAKDNSAWWDLKSQTVSAGETVIPVNTNAEINDFQYQLGTPNVSWMSWDTTKETEATIALVISENTSTSERSGTVSLYSDGEMTPVDAVTITQEGKTSSAGEVKAIPYWNLASSYTKTYKEQLATSEIKVTDEDNVGWYIYIGMSNKTIPGFKSSLLSSSMTGSISGTGTTSTGKYVYLPENTSTSAKTYKVYFCDTDKNILQTCELTQAGNSTGSGGSSGGSEIEKPVTEQFSISATSIILNSNGNQKPLTITYDGDWTATYEAVGDTGTNKLKLSSTSGTGNSTIYISSSMPNASTKIYAWNVVVTTSTGLTRTCKVYQQTSSV